MVRLLVSTIIKAEIQKSKLVKFLVFLEPLSFELYRTMKNKVMQKTYLKVVDQKKINNDHKKVQDVYLKLIKSMNRRIEACIASNGWPTKF